MIEIPGGPFKMGADDGEADEKPVHDVVVATFCLDKTEVTVSSYESCVSEQKCSSEHLAEHSDNGRTFFGDQRCNYTKNERSQHPVNCVDWDQADAYCKARGGRLPTEEEWEFAARGGSEQRKYPWGDADPGNQLCWRGQGNVGKRYGTCAVDLAAGASRWGAADLAGNVWEWTSGRYCPYPDNRCPDDRRVIRGGGWSDDKPAAARPSIRFPGMPAVRTIYVGFRCARTL